MVKSCLVSAAVLMSAACDAGAGPSEWAGFYAGLAVGAKLTDANWTTTQLADPPSAFAGTAVIDTSSPDRFAPWAARVGGYAGFNWQSERWLYGIEADLAWSDETDTHTGIPGCKVLCFAGAPGPGADLSSIRTLWDASLRLRVGYLVTPGWLIYGTGGVAWQAIEVSGTCANTLTDPICLASPPFALKTQTDAFTRMGWTVGAGAEHKLGAWLVRAEYRYGNFGTASGVLWASQPSVDPGADAVHYQVKLETHVGTLGIAYKF